tara:strand:+ start:2394 stop:2675 length:282 start_codon:yes stop_codon:yes gene_type:complete
VKQRRYVFIARDGEECYGKTLEDIEQKIGIFATVEILNLNSYDDIKEFGVKIIHKDLGQVYSRIYSDDLWRLNLEDLSKEYLKTIGRLEEIYI